MSEKKRIETLFYYLTKEAAQNSFIDWLEDRGFTDEEYEKLKAIICKELGIDIKRFYV